VLLILQASSEGMQRENLTHSTTFEDALTVIHETLGCSSVALKPALRYKLSNAPQKAYAISLNSQADWEGCFEDVSAAEIKSEKTAISVRIMVTEQVSF
jgi:hypothetical protein